jgi:hypothetical protein
MTKSSALVGLALPILALGIPILDTLFAILRRFLERRSLFAPDRSHFHHKLLDLGFGQRHARHAVYAATIGATGLGLFMMVRRDVGALVVFACILCWCFCCSESLERWRLRETVAALQRQVHARSRQKTERRTFEDLELRFGGADGIRAWGGGGRL